jgi:hypothetical protein
MLEARVTPTGTWTPLAAPLGALPGGKALDSAQTMVVLTNGDVMVHGGGDSASNQWYMLKPDSHGSYVNGSWSKLQASNVGRLFYGSAVLPNGDLFVLGGEDATDVNETTSGEIYDPATNHWKNIAPYPESQFGDSAVEVLANGDVLAGSHSGTGTTHIYDPVSDTWSSGPTALDGDNFSEEGWVKLADNSILDYEIQGTKAQQAAQRFVPGTFGQPAQWVPTGPVPVQLATNGGDSGIVAELGPGLLLDNGNVFWIGATNHTAIYNPVTDTWTQGPDIPPDASGTVVGAMDAPAAVEANGKVLFAVSNNTVVPLRSDGSANFQGPTTIYEYDPSAPSQSSIVTVPDTSGPDLGGPAFADRMVALPSHQILFSNNTGQLYVYTPDSGQNSAVAPIISKIVANGDGSYHLMGFQLNGPNEGAAYGDDAQMATNFPIVQLTDQNNNVIYATTTNWTSVVASSFLPESTDFSLPQGTPPGFYTINVIADGISSSPVLALFGSGNETVTVGTTSLFGFTIDTIASSNEGIEFYNPSAFAGIDILAGGGNNTINLQYVPSSIAITVGGGGSDILNIGNAGSVQGILGPVHVENPPNFTTIHVDDSADSVGRTVTIDTFTPFGDTPFGDIIGLAPGEITYEYADARSLSVATGSGGNTVNVAATGVSTTVIGGGNDTVEIGSSGNAQGIQGNLDIVNFGSTTSDIIVNDSADSTARTIVLSTHSTTFFGTVYFGEITGIAPAIITYPYGNGSDLSIDTGTGGNTVDVHGTGIPTTVVGGGADTVNIGNAGTVQGIDGEVAITNFGNTSSIITVDDSADPTARMATISTRTIQFFGTFTFGDINGLAPADITFAYANASTLTVDTGSGGNTVDVQGTGIPTTLLGHGTDSVNIGSGGSVQGIQGAVTIENPPSFTTIDVDDSADTVGRTVTLDTFASPTGSRFGTIVGLAPAEIMYKYGDTQNITVGTGSGGNSVNVRTTGVNTTLLGGGFDTVTVGDAGSVQGILGDLSIDNYGGTASGIIVDDSADPTGRYATLSTHSFTFFGTVYYGEISGLAPGNITYTYAAESSVALYTGTGGNTIDVQGTGVDTSLIDGGNDIVDVSNAGSVQGIQGQLTLQNSTGQSTITVDDSADRAAQAVTLQTLIIQLPPFGGNDRGNFGGGGFFVTDYGEVLGLAPATILYRYPDTSSISVDTGRGGSNVNVSDTGTTTNLNGSTFHDTVNVGVARQVAGIDGTLNIGNPTGFSTITVDDSADTTAQNVTLSTFTPQGDTSFGAITGLSPGTINYRYGDTTSVTLKTGKGGNTLGVQGTGVATTLISNGPDIVNVGDAGNTQGIGGELIVTDPPSFATLTVDDSADSVASNVALFTQTIAGVAYGTITGLSPATILYKLADTASPITVNGGSGTNFFGVGGGASFQTINLNTGTSNNSVLVSTTKAPLNVHGQNGSDLVQIGNQGTVQGIRGAISVDNAAGSTALTIDDSQDPTAVNATISDTAVTGLAPATISYAGKDLSSLNVFGGNGNSTFTVANTIRGAGTTLDTGVGNDIVNVQQTAVLSSLTVHGRGGTDEVVISDPGSVQNILGSVTVDNAGGATLLTADDSADTTARTVGINAGAITGLAPASIFTGSGVASLTVYGGSGGNTFTVGGTTAYVNLYSGTGNDTVNYQGSPSGNFTLDGQNGNDTVLLTSTAPTAGGSMTNFAAPVVVFNSQGSTRLTLDDSGDTTGRAVAIDTLTVTGLGAGGVEYGYGVTSLTIKCGGGGDTVTAVALPAIPVTLDGGGGSNVLVGPSAGSIWNITGPNSGTLGSIAYTNFANLTGGTGSDTFAFGANGSVSGAVNGGGGSGIDTLDYSARTSGVTVNLTTGAATATGGVANIANVIGTPGNDSLTGGPGTHTLYANGGTDTLNGASGTETFVLGATQSSATTVTGGIGTNTLVGANIANAWTINGPGSGNVNGILFTGIQNLTGGTASDTFAMIKRGSLAGNIVGMAPSSVLDYSHFGSPATINLQASTATAIGAWTNIQSFIGTGTSDSITAADTPNTWTINGANAGSVDGVTFAGFPNLTGGNKNDRFAFLPHGSITGSVDGGALINTLDYSGYGSAVTINLQSGKMPGIGTWANIQNVVGIGTTDVLIAANTPNTWSINGTNTGSVDGLSFSGFPNLTGGSKNDTFAFLQNGSITGNLQGGGPVNTLDYSNYGGPNSINPVSVNLQASTATAIGGTWANIRNFIGTGTSDSILGPSNTPNWSITGLNAGTIGGFSFSAFPNVTGGSGNNTFSFAPGAAMTGVVTGGTGTNTLDYSGYGSPVTVNLQTASTVGIGAWANIQFIKGTNTTDTLIGANNATNTWALKGSNAGSVDGVSFSGFANLTGGTGADNFQFAAAAKVSGVIDGRAGTNTLDYSAYNAVTVNLGNATTDLPSSSATGVNGGAANGIANINAVIAGSGNNYLTAAGVGTAVSMTVTGNGANILVGGAGSNVLTASGSGDNIIIGGQGTSTINGGTGYNLLIAGSTAYDDTSANLASVLATWKTATSAATYAKAISKLMSASNPVVLSPATVHGNASDTINAGTHALDWYFVVSASEITGQNAGETVTLC